MTSPLDELGIDRTAHSTPERDIIVPQEGDDYITSYYQILHAIERYTVHFTDDASTFPTPDYGPLVGIAPSTSDETDRNTVYVYDETESKWVDTFASVDELVTELEKKVENLDIDDIEGLEETLDDLDMENPSIDDIENLKDELNEIKDDISNNDNNIGSIDEDDSDLQTQINRLQTEINTLRESVNNMQETVSGFSIQEIDAPDGVDPHGEATISVKVYNGTTNETTQEVTLTQNNNVFSTELTLVVGETQWVDFDWSIPSTGGKYTFRLDTDEDTEYFSIDVVESTEDVFTIKEIDHNRGDTEVDITVKNVGAESGRQKVAVTTFDYGFGGWADTQQDQKNLSLDPGESSTDTYSIDYEDEEYIYYVETEDRTERFA